MAKDPWAVTTVEDDKPDSWAVTAVEDQKDPWAVSQIEPDQAEQEKPSLLARATSALSLLGRKPAESGVIAPTLPGTFQPQGIRPTIPPVPPEQIPQAAEPTAQPSIVSIDPSEANLPKDAQVHRFKDGNEAYAAMQNITGPTLVEYPNRNGQIIRRVMAPQTFETDPNAKPPETNTEWPDSGESKTFAAGASKLVRALLPKTPHLPTSLGEAVNAAASPFGVKETMQNPAARATSEVLYKTAPNALATLEAGAGEFNATLARTPNLIYNVAALPINYARRAAGLPEIEDPQYFEKEAQWWQDQAAKVDPGKARWQDKGENLVTIAKRGNPVETGEYLAYQVLKNAPQQALILGSAMAGMPGLGLGIAGTSTAAASLAEGRQLGADQISSTTNAVLAGTVEAAFEELGTAGQAEKWGKILASKFGTSGTTEILKTMLKGLYENVIVEGGEEFWTSLAQDYGKVITGVDKNAMKGAMSRAIESFAIGGTSAAVMTTPATVISGVHQMVSADGKPTEGGPEGVGPAVPPTKLDTPTAKALVGQSPDLAHGIMELAAANEIPNLPEVTKQAMVAHQEAFLSGATEEQAAQAGMEKFVEAASAEGTAAGQAQPGQEPLSPGATAGPENIAPTPGQLPPQTEGQTAPGSQGNPESALPVHEAFAGKPSVYQPEVPYDPSIRQHPNFSKVFSNADATVREYAAKLGREITPEFALQIGQEIHEDFHQVFDPRKTPAERRAAAEAIKKKYPWKSEYDLGKDTILLRDVAQSVVLQKPGSLSATGVSEYTKKILDKYSEPAKAKAAPQVTEASAKAEVEKAGAAYRGIQVDENNKPSMVLVNDPLSKTTISIPIADFSAKAVKDKIEESREKLNQIHDQEQFVQAVMKAAPHIPEKQVRVAGELMEARAKNWAKLTGRQANDYYATRLAGIYQGVAAGPESLNQSYSERLVEEDTATADEARGKTTEQKNARMKEIKQGLRDIEAMRRDVPSLHKNEVLNERYVNLMAEQTNLLRRDSTARVSTLNQEEAGKKAAIQFLENQRAIIQMFPRSDISSVIHELFHDYRRDLYRMIEEALPQYREQLEMNIAITEKWAGVKDGAWTREAEEKFARGFEHYMATGSAPVKGLQRIFEHFKEWLTDIYKGIKGSSIDVKISPEMRAVFDSLFTDSPERAGNVSQADVLKRAQAMYRQALESRRDAFTPLEQFVMDNGGIASYKGGAEAEEYGGLPVRFRGRESAGGKTADAMAKLANDAGVFQGNADDLRETLKNIKTRGPLQNLSAFMDQARREAEHEAEQGPAPDTSFEFGQNKLPPEQPLFQEEEGQDPYSEVAGINPADPEAPLPRTVPKVSQASINRLTGVTPPAEVKRYTATQVQRATLQYAAQAAAEADARARKEMGYESGWKEGEAKAMLDWKVAEAKGAAKTRAGEIQDIKKMVQDEIERLPISERGRFLATITNAQTPRAIIKTINRVDEALDKYQKRVLTQTIKRQFQRFEASKSIAVDYTQKIRGVMDGILLQKPRADTLAAIKETQKFIDQRRAEGENVSMPQYVMDNIRKLSAQPLADMSVAQIEDVLDHITTLAQLGKTKLRAMQEVDSAQKQADLTSLAETSVPITSHEPERALPGEELPLGKSLSNYLGRVTNVAMNTNYAIMPMDVVFDVLDGSKNYAGANYRIFKGRVDNDFTSYMNTASEWKDQAAAAAKGLDEKNMERIGVYAVAQQEGGVEKLINNGLTPEDIEKIKLTDKEKSFYLHMRRVLDALRPQIAETMRKVYNQDLGHVENYFPFLTDWDQTSEQDVRDRMLEEMQGLRRSTEKGFTKERKGAGAQKVNVNAMDVFSKHLDDVAYLLQMGPTAKYLGELAASDDYKAMVGNMGQRIVREWVDTIARKGGGLGDQQIKVLDYLRRNAGLAGLGLRLSTTALQLMPIFQGATLIGPYAFKGALDMGTSSKWRKAVSKNFPEIRERAGDDPAFRDFSGDSIKDKYGRLIMYPIQKLDAVTAASVGIGAFQKYMADHKVQFSISEDGDFVLPNGEADVPALKEAIAYAQRVVRRSQASGIFKDLPQALSRGRLTGNISFDKALLQYQSFALNDWSLLTHEGLRAGVLKGNLRQSFNVFLWTVVSALATQGMYKMLRRLLGKDEPKDSDWEQMAMNAITKVPFIGQLYSAVVYGSSGIPGIDVALKGLKGAMRAATGKKDATRARGIMDAAVGLSAVVGAPIPAQVAEILKGLYNDNGDRGGRETTSRSGAARSSGSR